DVPGGRVAGTPVLRNARGVVDLARARARRPRGAVVERAPDPAADASGEQQRRIRDVDRERPRPPAHVPGPALHPIEGLDLVGAVRARAERSSAAIDERTRELQLAPADAARDRVGPRVAGRQELELGLRVRIVLVADRQRRKWLRNLHGYSLARAPR